MPTIFLIVESKNDADVIQAILTKRNLALTVYPLTPIGGSPNISRLAEQLERLIATAKKLRQSGDCIAVLHDADIQTGRNELEQKQIQTICERFKMDVAHMRAADELESWLLADAGICEWFGIRRKNWDEQRQPSNTLEKYLKENARIRTGYDGKGRAAVLAHLAGNGDDHSPSMREASKMLTKPANKKDDD